MILFFHKYLGKSKSGKAYLMQRIWEDGTTEEKYIPIKQVRWTQLDRYVKIHLIKITDWLAKEDKKNNGNLEKFSKVPDYDKKIL